MSLSEQIRRGWARTAEGYTEEIEGLSSVAWVIRLKDGYGVAIPNEAHKMIEENFSAVILKNEHISISGEEREALVLLCEKDAGSEQPFSALCAEFVNPGKDGAARRQIEEEPELWWSEWKELLGNKNVDERVYDTLGELIVLRYLLMQGKKPAWNGPTGATYDIDCGKEFFEVKSTVKRSEREITLSNSFQLAPPEGKSLSIVLCQMERSMEGESINSVVSDLTRAGFDEKQLETYLKKLGLGSGKSARNRNYIVHAIIQYPVNEDFPAVTDRSFKDGLLPPQVKSITYTISLDGVQGIRWDEETDTEEIEIEPHDRMIIESLLRSGVAIEVIAAATKHTVEEIEKIRKSLK